MSGVRFALLGTLTVADATGNRTAVPGARQRALLAALLLSANLPVSCDALAEAVWDGTPPSRPAPTLRSHIRRLRHALGPETGGRITASDPGYLIFVQEPELDILRFETACRCAAAARQAGRWPEVSAAAARALELWRGTPLLDVPSQVLRDQFVPRLEQMRLQALEDRIEADLRLGHHDRLIPELRELTARHPVRERFHAQLIEALARANRRAEALEAYRHERRALVDELGIEPGPHLQRLHQQILNGDPALAAPPASRTDAPQAQAASTGRASSPARVPRQLPGTVPHFMGRSAEMARLSQILDQAGGQAPGTVVISAVCGTAGVGKTALAVHWAHRMARRFPDGQLYVNLCGFGPSAPPVTPSEAIRAFLSALGVPAEAVPPSLAAQAGLYRSLLAGQQLLILLDSARDEQQIRPLLPGAAGCLVLVTSRSQLAGLAATENAKLVSLDVLPPADARQMLTARLGDQRTAAEPHEITEITDLCARLPLALAVAGARAAARPQLPLAGLAAELRDARRRLDALDTGDPAASVRAVLAWSYQQLGPATARIFRLLGLHPGPDISVPAAASMAAVHRSQAHQSLRELTLAHLLTEHVPGRYAFHDLLRAYAQDQAQALDSAPERSAATGRLLDHYLHSAHAAAQLLKPALEPVPLGPHRPGVTPEDLTDQASRNISDYQRALAWFEAEHQILLAAVALAAEAGFDIHAWQLPWAMANFLDRRGHWQEWATVSRIAVAAVTRRGLTAEQAQSHRLSAIACIRIAEYEQARSHLAESLKLCQLLGDRMGEARARQNLSWLAEHQGRYDDALAHAEQAFLLYQAIDHRAGLGDMLNAVGWLHAKLGDYQQASACCRSALALHREFGDRLREAHAWDSLGYAEHHLGHHAQATDCYQHALGNFRELGDRYYEATILTHLGDAYQAADQQDPARCSWQQALRILEDLQPIAADLVRAKLAALTARACCVAVAPSPAAAPRQTPARYDQACQD